MFIGAVSESTTFTSANHREAQDNGVEPVDAVIQVIQARSPGTDCTIGGSQDDSDISTYIILCTGKPNLSCAVACPCPRAKQKVSSCVRYRGGIKTRSKQLRSWDANKIDDDHIDDDDDDDHDDD
jgi:hypothetical protein